LFEELPVSKPTKLIAMHLTLAEMTLSELEKLDRRQLLAHVSRHVRDYSQPVRVDSLKDRDTEELRELLKTARRASQSRGY
jgi:hypothetical protein